MSASVAQPSIVPAQLSFLAIYNPSLSHTDETLHEQIVYYYLKSGAFKPERETLHNTGEDDEKEEKNDRLRQIGLAQGMVKFAKNFSKGKAVDSIETEKSRILLHEIESDWWILASIDLTQLVSLPKAANPTASSQDSPQVSIEHSAREVSPTLLLLQQLIRAHHVFLLHHASNLNELLGRLKGPKFRSTLKRFWDPFARSWDVLLHGNPAVDVFNGLKLAAGGELGIGVGEEDWGSGEREVLEGFIARTEGLVDMVVSRFNEVPTGDVEGHPQPDAAKKHPNLKHNLSDWLGSGHDPGPSDGVIFSGIGAVSRPSMKRVSSWLELLFKHGRDAYGVGDNPTSASRPKRRQNPLGHRKTDSSNERTRRAHKKPDNLATEDTIPIGIPPPIFKSHSSRTNVSVSSQSRNIERGAEDDRRPSANGGFMFETEKLMKYMTQTIYRTNWGTPSKVATTSDKTSATISAKNRHGIADGFFIIGFQGDLEQDDSFDDEDDNNHGIGSVQFVESTQERHADSSRIMLRTIQGTRQDGKAKQPLSGAPESNPATESATQYERFRVIVYLHRPFIFAFLFELHTDSLAIPAFYRALHHQLGPLQRPLLKSTSPHKVSQRLQEAASPRSTASNTNSQPLYDLVYDPANLTVHTNIPNIPEPDSSRGKEITSPLTRIEALSVHCQLLSTHVSTRGQDLELERTCKTNRGWWVVWMRLPHVSASQQTNQTVFREAYLVRKASDFISPAAKGLGIPWSKSGRNGHGGGDGGPGKLAEGIGIDARQYIESLIGLNR